MTEMLRIYSNGFLENVTIEELTPGLSLIRNVFDFWNNLVLNYLWEPVPIGQRFLGSLRLWKDIRHQKCQFSPTSLRAQIFNSCLCSSERFTKKNGGGSSAGILL